ncbi:MAG: ShlB/FhaC/HecB family hemolysin secretion/activation protein [Methylococcales bacterium]|nr:ShlB/FhaC/HecB family hemolysin secretion/activation protein [Methylococcales bacterium]
MLKPLCLALSLSLLPATLCLAEDVAPGKFKFPVNKFSVEGESLESILSADEISDYLKPFQEKSYDLKELQEVGKGLEAMIRDEGFAFYRVILPPQSLNSGEVKLKVIAFDVGNINVEGNDNFSKEGVIASLPELQKDVSPNTHDLAASTRVANKHPSKQIQLTFKQSETEDKVDANIKVVEQPRPYQFSLGFNNTGSDSSGEYRLTGGAQYSNLWGLDHVVNASYTLPPDHADTIKQYGGTYALPIYALKSWVNMYYASSSSNNGVVATDLTITGAGEMMGIHYQQFLPKFEKYEHSLDIGIDSKYFINDVQFKKTQVGTNVRSLPFSISYKAEYPFEYVRSGYFVQWAINTGLGSDNNDLLYSKSRAGSDSSWQLFRYGTNFSTSYEQWSLSTSLTGQFSQKPLIAGEQVGIGGSYDVRGYEQRETGADNGQIVKVELTSPAWEKINAFVFYDYGHGSKEKPQAGELKDWNLSGTGIGTRWQWREYVNASLTFATALNDATTTRAFNNRLLLNVNMRY